MPNKLGNPVGATSNEGRRPLSPLRGFRLRSIQIPGVCAPGYMPTPLPGRRYRIQETRFTIRLTKLALPGYENVFFRLEEV